MDSTFSLSTLYVVATPIGNMDDMSPRGVDVLRNVELIAAEDTRHSQRLLSHFNIRAHCVPYHEHSEEKTTQRVINVLQSGGSVALISDAGTPLISDPGYRLLDSVLLAGYKVAPIPGPSAVVTALSVAGLPTDSFLFDGFLPSKSTARKARLQSLNKFPHTMIFYEAPHRIAASLQDFNEVFGGERLAVLARELSKLHETLIRQPLAELLSTVLSDPNQQRGEIVLLLAGFHGEQTEREEVDRILQILLQDLPVKQASQLAAQITGQKKNELYSRALNFIKQKDL